MWEKINDLDKISLHEWVNRFRGLQCQLGYSHPIKDPFERWQYYKDQTFALIVEAVEAVQNTPWKPWKPASEQPFEKMKTAYEICDMFVFVFNLWITLNPPISLEDAMENTIKKIEKRIKNENYGKQDKKEK